MTHYVHVIFSDRHTVISICYNYSQALEFFRILDARILKSLGSSHTRYILLIFWLAVTD
jgi:hypothetical protein